MIFAGRLRVAATAIRFVCMPTSTRETYLVFHSTGGHLGAVSARSANAAAARARALFGDDAMITCVPRCSHCGAAHATDYDGEALRCRACGSTPVEQRVVESQPTGTRWALVVMGTGCGEVTAVFRGSHEHALAQVRGEQVLVNVDEAGVFMPGKIPTAREVEPGWLYEGGDFFGETITAA